MADDLSASSWEAGGGTSGGRGGVTTDTGPEAAQPMAGYKSSVAVEKKSGYVCCVTCKALPKRKQKRQKNRLFIAAACQKLSEERAT